MNQPAERCAHCGKIVYRSWQEAAHHASRMRRRSERTKGIEPYWATHCRCFHLGLSGSTKYRHARDRRSTA